MSTYRHLKVEEPKVVAIRPEAPVNTRPVAPDALVVLAKERDDWRAQAIQAGERLQHAETQLRDLRSAADESRARMNKAKTRQDSAQAKVNELQVETIRLRAELDDAKDRLKGKETAMRLVWEAFQELQG